MSFETIVLTIAIVIALYKAWTIGANDVANAFGTSVGSKAITIVGAMVIAAIFEFLGAFLVGGTVTETVAKGIIDVDMFIGHERLFLWGMIAAQFGAAIWLNLATVFGLPVSTTHATIGAVVGAGICSGWWMGNDGFGSVQWADLIPIASSWVISPIFGGVLAFLVFFLIKKVFFDSLNPTKNLITYAPYLVFAVIVILVFSVIYKGLKNVNINLGFDAVVAIALGAGLLFSMVATWLIRRHFLNGSSGTNAHVQLENVELVFKYLQILTACYVAFAHGANDVANAVGPLAGVLSVLSEEGLSGKSSVPSWALLVGALGIVIGLATYGYKVIETIGRKITELTPTRGFSAEFGTATTVLLASLMGLPISTTHVLVGAVIGVGFARGMANINGKVIRDIVSSWVVTIPLAIIITIIINYIFLFIFET